MIVRMQKVGSFQDELGTIDVVNEVLEQSEYVVTKESREEYRRNVVLADVNTPADITARIEQLVLNELQHTNVEDRDALMGELIQYVNSNKHLYAL